MAKDNSLAPDKIDFNNTDPEASKKWAHWKRIFTAYLESIDDENKPINKLNYLIRNVNHEMFELIEEAKDYDEAIKLIEKVYKKEVNILFARHTLLTRRQKESETTAEYLLALKSLSKECSFTAVDAITNREHYIRDSFVAGLINMDITQKILESSETELAKIATLSQVYEDSKKNTEKFKTPNSIGIACAIGDKPPDPDLEPHLAAAAPKEYTNNSANYRCYWCGRERHPKFRCPARDHTCKKCTRIGHYERVCKANIQKKTNVSSAHPFLASIVSAPKKEPKCLSPSTFDVGLNGFTVNALWDTGSAENYIHPSAVNKCKLPVIPESGEVAMADTEQLTKTSGYVTANLTVNGKKYLNIKLTILNNACASIILGIDFLAKHKQIVIKYGGTEPPLISSNDDKSSVSASLGTLKANPPLLFHNLTADCHPIRTKSRRFNVQDRLFIKTEIKRLLEEGIIEKSFSPWRAQVHVAGGGNQKKRLVVDYSRTINRFTLLDAYPLPRIDDMLNDIAQNNVFSTVDMLSAYHQYKIADSDKPYTAFEADGGLYQFKRLPFGVTNGVSAFQRQMDNFVAENGLQGTFPYLDNITICGKDQEEHDKNLNNFLEAAHKINLTYNKNKCEFSTTKLHILGSVIENNEIRPDPNRLKPLLEMPVPKDMKELKRLLGFFSYYSKYIRNFSQKIKALVNTESFPLSQEAIAAFESLKLDIANSVVCAIKENESFTVESDASDYAIAATLNQSGRPVAFFSRTLHGSELKHSSVEKEAQAIVEAVRHWRHFLTGRHFHLITDQKSVSFMFHAHHKGKIKNDKITRWRMELMGFHFDITYRPGSENVPPDTFSRNCASVTKCASAHNLNKLRELHVSLCHPGITRMIHFIKLRNLPYSTDEIRKICNACPECAEIKPRFHRPEPTKLIKATQPFERLNIDFKGPLPSNNKNRYFLTVIDEFSRFPFAIPCCDMTSGSVISALCSLFSLFGMPSFIHSDRGPSLVSKELREFLNSRGISCSRTTPYNPEGNGQVEKTNHTIWRAVTLALKSKGLSQEHWQEVLPDVLHSIRSLLCTATNATPHEKLFGFQRRSGTGSSLPSWLSTPGPVLLRRFVRHSKNDPLVDEVELIEANPQYAFIKKSDGTETTVSIKDLAPRGRVLPVDNEIKNTDNLTTPLELEQNIAEEGGFPIEIDDSSVVSSDTQFSDSSPVVSDPSADVPCSVTTEKSPELRRSTRIKFPPKRLIDEVQESVSLYQE